MDLGSSKSDEKRSFNNDEYDSLDGLLTLTIFGDIKTDLLDVGERNGLLEW